MPGFTVNGTPSKVTFLHTEAHKTTQEFVAAAAILPGQQVMMNATGDVIIWTAASGRSALIGVAYNKAAIGETVTVWTRGYAIVWGLSNAAVVCNLPVTVSSYDTTNPGPDGVSLGFVKYANYTEAAANNDSQACGWALDDASAANQAIRVLLMD